MKVVIFLYTVIKLYTLYYMTISQFTHTTTNNIKYNELSLCFTIPVYFSLHNEYYKTTKQLKNAT